MSDRSVVHGIEPELPVAENAPLVIAARVQELLDWEQFARDPARVEEIHRMRVAAKRLRYTVEIFLPALGAPARQAIERFRAVQDLLGDIHDLDVVIPILTRRARRALRPAPSLAAWQAADYSGSLGLIALCRRKQAERRQLHRRFLAEWRRLRRDQVLETLMGTEPRTDTKGDGDAVVS